MRDRSKLSERQRGILRFMETYLETQGFPPTIREIGEATGINSTSVVNYNLNKLVDAGFLERASSKSRGIRLVTTTGKSLPKQVVASNNIVRVPLVGQIVASAPVAVPDDVGYYFDEDDLIDVSVWLLGGADPSEVFALRVKGDSMIDAMIGDGDIVIFRKQNYAENGDMVAVWLDERGETTLKRFFHENDRIRLQPEHPTMKPIYVDPAHCHVQGRVLSVIRHIG
ncbi:MAG: transcriptional repressor LexA [Chloroflexota bacterium]|nr:MAG: repressor LexA [Chloroflexota bacterium]